MAVNAFVYIKNNKGGDTPGESYQAPFTNWIEVQSWTWDVTAETSVTKGSGSAVGKAEPGKLKFSHYFNTAAPVMLSYIVQGSHFPEVVLVLCKTTGASTPTPYLAVTLLQAFVTSVSINASEDGSCNMDVELVSKQIRIDYKKQLQSGDLDKTMHSFHWDIAAHTTNNPITATKAAEIFK